VIGAISLVAVLSLGLAPTDGFAQGGPIPKPDDREKASRYADEGYDLLQKKKYDRAIALFRKAEALAHSPMFLYFIGEAQFGKGRWLEARAIWQGVVDEKPPLKPTASFQKAQKMARTKLANVNQRIPTFTLVLQGVDYAAVQATLDGQPLEAAQLQARIPVDPGKHTVVVTATDGRQQETTFQAVDRQSTDLKITFGATGPPDEPVKPVDPVNGDEGSGKSYLWPAIAYGVGGAGLALWGITGIMFISRAGDLKDQCPDNRCPANLESEGDTVSTLGTVSTVGLVVGAVGVAAGTILLFVPGDDDEPAAQTSWRPTVRVGLGAIQIEGTF